MRKDKVKDRLGKQDVYQPANDEPCVFANSHRKPVNPGWIAWYIRKNPRVSFAEVYKRGEELIKRLENEPHRDVDPNVEPVKYFGPPDTQVLRLEWVIWYRYTYNVGFGSAYFAGLWGELDRDKFIKVHSNVKEDPNE